MAGQPEFPEFQNVGSLISRKRFLLTIGSGSILLAACSRQSTPAPISTRQPEKQVNNPPFVDSQLGRIGQELDAWEITTQGKNLKMAEAFDSVRIIADILAGRTDPRSYLSHLKLPITLGQIGRQDIAGLALFELKDPHDSRKIEIQLNNQKLVYPWIREVVARVQLSDDLRRTTTAKLPFVVKELMHFVDFSDYYRSYLKNNPAVKADFINPSNIPTPADQILYNRGALLHTAELDNLDSPIHFFIDAGTGIKVFTPLYATWQLNEQQQGRVIPNTEWSKLGNRYVDFLKEKKLFVEQDGLITWAPGKTPKIDSLEFVRLVDEYLKRFFQFGLLGN